MDLSPKGDVLAINHITIDQGSVNSSLIFLGFGDATLQDPNRIIGAQILPDEWLAEVKFYKGNHMIGFSDHALIFYDLKDGPSLVATYNLDMMLTDYVMTEDGIMLSLLDQLTMESYMVIIDYEGKEINNTKLETPLIGFESDESSYYLITDYQIEKYDNGKRIWFTKTSRPVSDIISLGKEYYLIEYPSSYEVIRMKDI
jgi:hypothetical protein